MNEINNNRSASRQSDGYSAIELLIVAAMVIALTSVAVFSLTAQRRAYSTDDSAAQVAGFLRDAYQRAISQRQTMRVQLDRTNRLIKLIDENRLTAGDETEVRRAKLSNQVSLDQPVVGGVLLGPPPAPYSYPVAVYSSGVWEARFRSDGSVVDTAGNPLSATLFFSPANMTSSDANLIRAITMFGTSGSMRTWRYTGQTFDAGAR